MLQKSNIAGEQDEAGNAGAGSSVHATGLISRIGFGVAQLALMAIVLALAFAATFYLVNTKPEVPKKPVFPTVYTVETLMAKQGVHQPEIRVYGEIVAARSVDLRSLVSGQVTAVNPKLKSGGVVDKGEVLLEVDRFNFEGALREAQANAAETEAKIQEANARVELEKSKLASLRDQLQLASNDLSRIEQLRSRGTATEKQVEDRKLILSQREQAVEQSEITLTVENARIEQLRATMLRLDWKIEQSKRDLENTRLTAPFRATVSSSSVEIGKLVNANDVVVSMYQGDSLEARFVLTDERFGRLQADRTGVAGREVEVVWNVGGIDYSYSGVVDRIGAEITSASGGVELFAIVNAGEGPVQLRPGAFVEITLPDRTFEGHFRIPEASLYEGNRVYVAVDGALQERLVEVAAHDGEDVLIAAGLEDGDEVLVTRISEIGPGLKVQTEDQAARSGTRDGG
ncbi:MAG: efflux RND transporter periplasmic adaptor subunit [Nitratireductor sp.]|nr:efflux RND transporter periplasmic adaptor subunit [Nitratireductor sp.]